MRGRVEHRRIMHVDDLVADENGRRIAEIDDAAAAREQGEHQLLPDHALVKADLDRVRAAHRDAGLRRDEDGHRIVRLNLDQGGDQLAGDALHPGRFLRGEPAVVHELFRFFESDHVDN
ncbi:hypothetical protein NGUA09_02589 [Salmonella enterica]|nr:hypothetical protein NGUA09_02589 [Salmonella enterica]